MRKWLRDHKAPTRNTITWRQILPPPLTSTWKKKNSSVHTGELSFAYYDFTWFHKRQRTVIVSQLFVKTGKREEEALELLESYSASKVSKSGGLGRWGNSSKAGKQKPEMTLDFKSMVYGTKWEVQVRGRQERWYKSEIFVFKTPLLLQLTPLDSFPFWRDVYVLLPDGAVGCS